MLNISSTPSSQTRQIKQAETISSRLNQDQQASDQQQERIQQLISRSMDAEFLQNNQKRTSTYEAQAATVRGMQKQVSAYVITQEQRDLIGAPMTLGYA